MDDESLEKEIKSILVATLGLPIDADAIGNDEPLWQGGLNIGSMAAIEILTILEDRFDVQFPDEAIGPNLFASVRTLADAVRTLSPNTAG